MKPGGTWKLRDGKHFEQIEPSSLKDDWPSEGDMP
jgi:hypothetical protein